MGRKASYLRNTLLPPSYHTHQLLLLPLNRTCLLLLQFIPQWHPLCPWHNSSSSSNNTNSSSITIWALDFPPMRFLLYPDSQRRPNYQCPVVVWPACCKSADWPWSERTGKPSCRPTPTPRCRPKHGFKNCGDAKRTHKSGSCCCANGNRWTTCC